MFPALIPVVIGLGSMFYGAVNFYKINFPSLKGICNINALRNDLNGNLYGQSDAINHFTGALSESLYHPGVHAILLVGGPGVGKTYTASMLRKHYQPPQVITYIVPKLQPFSEALLFETKNKIYSVATGFSLVIIDGIDFDNKELMNFIKELHSLHRFVKVIVIGEVMKTYSLPIGYQSVASFESIQEYRDFITAAGKDALNIFRSNKIDSSEILFMPLSSDVVKQCINNAVKTNYRKPLTDDQLTECVDQIMDVNSNFAFSGCKDVDAFVSMYDHTQLPIGFAKKKYKEVCPYPYWMCMLFKISLW